MKKFIVVLLTLAYLGGSRPLNAEIQQIVMKWNAQLCLNICIPTLQQQLSNIENITDIQINPRAGTAVMRWKPYYPFSYEPFNLATRVVGIRIADFRIKVRGTVIQTEDNFYIVSVGDGTTFLLLGPIQAIPNRYIVQQNIASRPLTPEMRLKLLNAAYTKQIVEIEGPLFEPLRYWLALIVEQLRILDESSMDRKYNI